MARKLGGFLSKTEVFDKTNLIRLALVSGFLTAMDTIQSFYFQRVINVFSEANVIPRWFYGFGYIGYIIYAPIEFTAMFLTLITLWAWASYVLWYYRNVVTRSALVSEAHSLSVANSDN